MRTLAVICLAMLAAAACTTTIPRIEEPSRTLDSHIRQSTPLPDLPRKQAGAAFIPVGWHAPGTCTSSREPFTVNRDSVRAHLSMMRRHAINVVVEPASADGRVIARAASNGTYNWYGYSYVDADGRNQSHGHPRPGAFVEGMLWLLAEAYNDGRSPIRVIVSLNRFIVPGYEGDPYDGSEMLSCNEYASLIHRERENNQAIRTGIPPVTCPVGAAERPFWEWNVSYIVQNLDDHPGLYGWYLWDEPEGITYRHLFGIHEGEPPPPYLGPESLPTTDLLRYAYDLVGGMGAVSHPVIVDIHSPHVFFSDRFEWAVERRKFRWESGPFDVTPSGSFQTPADIVGLEASGALSHTGPTKGVERLAWYWDPNYLSRKTVMLQDVVDRDELAFGMVVSGQAQLPSRGGYALEHPLRCEPNDQKRARLLNDQDLVWQFLTPFINGMQGYVFYSHALMPSAGPGAHQAERSNRLIQQFKTEQFDSIFATTAYDAFEVTNIEIQGLTNYFRGSFAKAQPDKQRGQEVSAFSQRLEIDIEDYDVAHFGRSNDPSFYGHALYDPPHDIFEDHTLLRLRMYRASEDVFYLFVSNSYDAIIHTTVNVDLPCSLDSGCLLEEGTFRLAEEVGFTWGAPSDVHFVKNDNGLELRIGADPYQARVFRIELET